MSLDGRNDITTRTGCTKKVARRSLKERKSVKPINVIKTKQQSITLFLCNKRKSESEIVQVLSQDQLVPMMTMEGGLQRESKRGRLLPGVPAPAQDSMDSLGNRKLPAVRTEAPADSA